MSAIAALAGIGSAITSFYNANKQYESQQEMRKAQLHLYERQRQDTINLMNMQNAYNSPKSQMSRLEEAGLNPMLIYGSGTIDHRSATATPASPPQLQPMSKYLDPIGFQQIAQIRLQTESMKLQNRQLDLQNKSIEAENRLKERQGNLFDEQAETEETKRANTASQTELNYQAYKFNAELKSIEVEMQSLDYSHRKMLYPLQEINATLQNDKLRADILNVQVMTLADKLLKGAQLSEITQNVKLSEQQYQFLDAVNDYRVITERYESGFDPSSGKPLGNLKMKWIVKHAGDMVSSFFKFFK